MREIAKEKMGYYPAPVAALQAGLRYIKKPASADGLYILDPCAGEGEAIQAIAEHLGLGQRRVFAIEIDSGRSEAIAQRMPDCRLLKSTSWFGSNTGHEAFSLAYVNSPFGADPLDGRIEVSWLKKACTALPPGGILMQVLPYATTQTRQYQQAIGQAFHSVSIIEFPAEHRGSSEVIVLAIRSDKFYAGRPMMPLWYLPRQIAKVPRDFCYEIPVASGPFAFKKTSLTEYEIAGLLDKSPLNDKLRLPVVPEVPRPPMALHTGHLALLLASGMIDGVVVPANGDSPHVIRGTARKVLVTQEDGEPEVKDVVVQKRSRAKPAKQTTTHQIVKEKIEIVVRVADESGTITTLT